MLNAHAPSTVCCPSRTSLLTGRYPHKTGVYGNVNNLKKAVKARDLTTLPQYFSKHGYHTLSRGKIFHVHGDDKGQWAFDEVVPAEGNDETVMKDHLTAECGAISRPSGSSLRSGTGSRRSFPLNANRSPRGTRVPPGSDRAGPERARDHRGTTK